MSAHLFDPYRILEIAEDADETAIRRAFRKLAMRWHPDRNGDPAATERFKQIRAAYEHLMALDEDETAADDPAEDVPPRGEDRHDELWLTLEEAMMGCDKPYTIRRERECPDCEGLGTVELSHTRMCGDCHGSGRRRTAAGLAVCESCGGKGFVTRAPCGACAGSGRRVAEQVVMVHVAAGVLPGEVLRLKGLGHPPAGAGEPGTLYLTLRLREHALFRLDGRDLLLRQPVSALRLMAGGQISVAGPLGPIVVKLAPGDVEGRELKLAGHGFPGRGGRLDEAGELRVEFEPVLPQRLDEALRTTLARLEAELQSRADAHYPTLQTWWQSYRASLD